MMVLFHHFYNLDLLQQENGGRKRQAERVQSERKREREGDHDGVNKAFVCPSAVLTGLDWCLVPGVQGNFLS